MSGAVKEAEFWNNVKSLHVLGNNSSIIGWIV